MTNSDRILFRLMFPTLSRYQGQVPEADPFEKARGPAKALGFRDEDFEKLRSCAESMRDAQPTASEFESALRAMAQASSKGRLLSQETIDHDK